MGSIKKVMIIAMISMAVISFANLSGFKIAGISVCIGVVFFFINKSIEKQAFSGSGLDFDVIGPTLKEKSIWLWITMPIIMDAVSITLAKLFLPGYIDHVLARVDIFITFDKLVLMIAQLAVLALGEEIAWRAFFQKQLNKVLSFTPVIIVSSLLFAIGHITSGSLIIVAYDIFFVFINSILYGIIFHKSNNAWISAISHFTANLFSIVVLAFL